MTPEQAAELADTELIKYLHGAVLRERQAREQLELAVQDRAALEAEVLRRGQARGWGSGSEA